MKWVVFVAALAAVGRASAAAGQPALELTQSAGVSTEDVAAAATQVAAFGELPAGFRFSAEAAWGARSTERGDAFGTAYPYDNRLHVMEAYVERAFRPGAGLLSVRGGRYRTPFGISAASEHAYIGFLRAPLIRYDGYFALSNTFLEHGVDIVVGTPALSLEVSAGVPADVGSARRPSGLDWVLRSQWFHGAVIVGASYIRTRPYQSPLFAHGRSEFGGIDVRWMRGGVGIRGEWLAGRPFDGTRTDGGYLDLILHRPRMGPVTVLGRVERLVYEAVPPFAFAATRYTGGARVRVRNNLAVTVGLVRQVSDDPAPDRGSALDLGLTYAYRHQ
jgi:hypothetical protein